MEGGLCLVVPRLLTKRMSELSSLLKLRRELTSTPGPLPEVLQNLYQACAATAAKELAAPLML